MEIFVNLGWEPKSKTSHQKLKKVMKTHFFIYVENFKIDDHIDIITQDDLFMFMTGHASEKGFPLKNLNRKILS